MPLFLYLTTESKITLEFVDVISNFLSKLFDREQKNINMVYNLIF
jgi:ribosome maturation factor RimP